jgi:uncharacterized glyoxalase superfamily protein PhnB
VKKSAKTPFMPAEDYGRSLTGFNVNLLVREVAPIVRFLKDVLEIDPVYHDADLAILRHEGVDWLIHAEHTYDDRPMLARTRRANLRGAGCELRLYNLDPDAAEARARRHGYQVLAPSEDKPHGLRECYLVDPEGYVWVPARGLL